MAKPFYTDNMTVDEILSLGDDVLNKMDRRDLSRALRTVSLAANKRIQRLLNKAEVIVDKKTGDITYKEKGNQGISFDALYFTKGKKFSAAKTKDRNEIYKEFAKVRRFMNAGSTTISGAIELRKKRERAVFGKTHEELTKGMSKLDKAAAVENLNELIGDVYKEFHKFKEEYQIQGGYTKEWGKRVIKMLARRMRDKGMSGEEARMSVAQYYDKKYEVEQDESPLQAENDSYWNEVTGNNSEDDLI